MEKATLSIATCILWGGFIGPSIIGILFAVLRILCGFHVEIGRYFLSTAVVLTISLMELPVVTISRALQLSVECGGAAFLLYNLNPLGYALLYVFWASIGVTMGFLVGIAVQL